MCGFSVKLKKEVKKVKFKNKPDSTLKWFVIGIIPILNLYWFWRVSNVLANIERERGD